MTKLFPDCRTVLTASFLALVLVACGAKKSEQQIATDRTTASLEAFQASGKALVVLQAKSKLVVNLFQQEAYVPVGVQVAKDGKLENAVWMGSSNNRPNLPYAGVDVVPSAKLVEPGKYSMLSFRFGAAGVANYSASPGLALAFAKLPPLVEFTVEAGEVVNLGSLEFFAEKQPSGSLIRKDKFVWRAEHTPDYTAGAQVLQTEFPQLAPLAVQRAYACKHCIPRTK